jgi:AcrR family transcriptional regulator
LFGLRADVNDRSRNGSRPGTLELSPVMQQWLREDAVELTDSGNRALTALLSSGRGVFVTRGYHNTRVDDLVSAAGVSHGAFYRYFRNKDELARILTARAMRATGTTLIEIPDAFTNDTSAVKGALRRWLRRFQAVQAPEAGMMRVWIDAALQDPALRADLAPPLDWGRRRMSHYLQPRAFGDVQMEAVVMVALLGVFGGQPRSSTEIDAAAHVIERGLLGR